ncbi:MAG: hypothetical protein ABIW83_02570, partial [Allosphingosinicella sp.]
MRVIFACAVLVSSLLVVPNNLIAQYDYNSSFDYYYYPEETSMPMDKVGYAQGGCAGPNGPPIYTLRWGYQTPYSEAIYIGQC